VHPVLAELDQEHDKRHLEEKGMCMAQSVVMPSDFLTAFSGSSASVLETHEIAV
jgi:hypothetical protein